MRNIMWLVLLVVGLLAVYGQSQNDAPPTDSDRCSKPYDVERASYFSKHDKIVYTKRRSHKLVISNVEVVKRGFYMCRPLHNYGFNDTHWYIQKGCSGTFRITECEPVLVPASADLANLPVPL